MPSDAISLAAPPGTVFNYNSGSTELLGVILRKVSGKRLDQFAKEVLFDPLGSEAIGLDNDVPGDGDAG